MALEDSTVDDVSIDDTIRDTLREISAREPVDDKPDTPVVEKPARDEAGKFAPKTPEVGKPDQPALIAPVEVAPVAEKPAEQEYAVPPELQRLGLKKEEAQAFQAAPKALQDAFMRRAEEMGKGIEQYKGKAQFADQLGAVIAPHMQTIQQLGVTPAVAVGELLKADHALRYGSPEQKIEKLQQLARDYGIQFQPTGEAAPMDPNVQALQQELRQMRGFIQSFQNGQQEQTEQTANSQIAQFAADPKHEHFASVREQMGQLIQAGAAQDLAGAYEMAVWSNPTTRAALIAKQQADAIAEATRRAQEAREAASTNVRARPSLPVSEPVGSIEDTIRATLRRLQNA
jgi:hypothetical protein